MKALKIFGHMYDIELKWLAEQSARSFLTLEVGCLHGRSTAALCEFSPGFVVTVDDWSGLTDIEDNKHANTKESTEVHYQIACEHLAEWLETGRLKIIKESFQTGPTIFAMIAQEIKFDFIFLDGDHREEPFRIDLKNALELISPQGRLSGHDRQFPGVSKVLSEVPYEIKHGPGSIWIIDFKS